MRFASVIVVYAAVIIFCSAAGSQVLNAPTQKPTIRTGTSATVNGNNNVVINGSEINDRSAAFASAILNSARPPASEFLLGDELEPIKALEVGPQEKREIARAFLLYERAARKGNHRARVELGRLLIDVGTAAADARACEEFEQAAKHNISDAIAWQAWMHDTSRVPNRSVSLALDLYEQAAKAGVGWAAFTLGIVYQKPALGASKDEAKALQWYWRAAENYDARAFGEISWILRFGEQKHRDVTKAIRLLEQGAKLNDCNSLFHLGYSYHEGEHVVQDYRTAVEYYSRASACGDNRAQNNLGNLHVDGLGTPRHAEAAEASYRKAIQQGNATAANNLALMYEKGNGVPRDYRVTANWYRFASERGNAQAKARLGVMYERGNGVERDVAKAMQLFKESADARDTEGALNLAIAHDSGESVYRDKILAAKWYRQAIELGSSDAMNNLAHAIDTGSIAPLPNENSVDLWARASKKENRFAMWSLGYRYIKSTVAADVKKGEQLLRESAKQGHMKAKVVVADLLYRRQTRLQNELEEAIRLATDAMPGDTDAAALLHSIAMDNPGSVPKKDLDHAIKRLEELLQDPADGNHSYAAKSLATAARDNKSTTVNYARLINALYQLMEKGDEQAALHLFLLYGVKAPQLFLSKAGIALLDKLIDNAGPYAAIMRVQREHFLNPSRFSGSEELIVAMDQAAIAGSDATRISWSRVLASRQPDIAGSMLRTYIVDGKKSALAVLCDLIAEFKVPPASAAELSSCTQ
jgi:uncharacterized protein